MAESLDAFRTRVREWFAADPWTVHDICPVAEVREWTIYLDGRPG